MNLLTSTFYISMGVLAYLVVALATAGLVRKTGGNLKEMAGRTSSTMLLIGATANLIVLAIILLLIVHLDRLPLTALGLTLSGHDSLFALIAATTPARLTLPAISLICPFRGRSILCQNVPPLGGRQRPAHLLYL